MIEIRKRVIKLKNRESTCTISNSLPVLVLLYSSSRDFNQNILFYSLLYMKRYSSTSIAFSKK